jgi:hypothetical protein
MRRGQFHIVQVEAPMGEVPMQEREPERACA